MTHLGPLCGGDVGQQALEGGGGAVGGEVAEEGRRPRELRRVAEEHRARGECRVAECVEGFAETEGKVCERVG